MCVHTYVQKCIDVHSFSHSLVHFLFPSFMQRSGTRSSAFYTLTYTHTYNPEKHHIHTYVHTYLHTYIHTYIHACSLVRFGCVVWCVAGQAVACTPHDGEDSLSVQALGFSWLYFFDVGSGVYNFVAQGSRCPSRYKVLIFART